MDASAAGATPVFDNTEYANNDKKAGGFEVLTDAEDALVLEIAKHNIEAKKRLVGQVWEWLALSAFIALMMEYTSNYVDLGWFFIFEFVWTARMIYRFTKFIDTSRPGGNGLIAYLRERKQREFENEVNRLKSGR